MKEYFYQFITNSKYFNINKIILKYCKNWKNKINLYTHILWIKFDNKLLFNKHILVYYLNFVLSLLKAYKCHNKICIKFKC